MNLTCEERIDEQLESYLEDLGVLYNRQDFYTHEEFEAFKEKFENVFGCRIEDEADLEDKQQQASAEYGLCFDYVDGEEDGTENYYRYQLCWGGPSAEFRFYVIDEHTPTVNKIDFVFLDWFDGATRTLSGEDYDLLYQVFETFI